MRLELIERKKETPDVESFIFKPQEALTFKPGQFFHYVLHHEPTDNRGSDRWFTCASAPFEGVAMITTRLTAERGSSFKQALVALKIGDSVEISEVEGDFVVDDLGAQYVFIAGGIGITPYHSILKQLDHEGQKINATLMYANRDANFPYKAEFEAFAARNPNLKIHYLVSPERVDEAKVRELVPDLSIPIFYVSGPEPMVESLGQMLQGLGIAKDHIKQDWFPGYPAE